MKQNLLEAFGSDLNSPVGPSVAGTKHADRVFIPDATAQSLLRQYADGSKPLTREEYSKMLSLLQKHPHLASLVASLQETVHDEGEVINQLGY